MEMASCNGKINGGVYLGDYYGSSNDAATPCAAVPVKNSVATISM